MKKKAKTVPVTGNEQSYLDSGNEELSIDDLDELIGGVYPIFPIPTTLKVKNVVVRHTYNITVGDYPPFDHAIPQ